MARRFNFEAKQAEELAARHRDQRDDLIRRLRAEDPTTWSYGALARAVGISPELVAAIVKSRRAR